MESESRVLEKTILDNLAIFLHDWAEGNLQIWGLANFVSSKYEDFSFSQGLWVDRNKGSKF